MPLKMGFKVKFIKAWYETGIGLEISLKTISNNYKTPIFFNLSFTKNKFSWAQSQALQGGEKEKRRRDERGEERRGKERKRKGRGRKIGE